MIKFGPSGNSDAFALAGNVHTEQSAQWVKNAGLDCFEYSFGRGVRITDEKARSIKSAFDAAGVEISVHAPYYVNFANPDDIMGGRRVVFHPASQGKAERAQAVSLTRERLCVLRDKIYENGLSDMLFCPETMGKIAQIGTVEEITDFCSIDDVFVPCVDFGHVNAREQGSLKTRRDYENLLGYMTERLGYEKMKEFHVHFSKIEYSAKGEVRHLTFADDKFGPEFPPLAAALKTLRLEPYIVSESAGTQDVDALAMKKIYFGL